MSLTIGRIAYLNVEPYFYYLQEQGFSGQIVPGVPSELNRMLAEGLIDACPSSSFEYAVNPEKYLLLENLSISSIGPVHSVLFFSREPISNLVHREIVVTGESATSINLLQVLLYEFFGSPKMSFVLSQKKAEEQIDQGQNVLLIGDRALTARQNCPNDIYCTDLGALWYQFTKLPFVFALWILRKQIALRKRSEIVKFVSQLRKARSKAFQNLPLMAAFFSGQTGFSEEQLERYWRKMSYDLTDSHLRGLCLYYQLCKKHGLLSSVPEINFFL